MQRCSILIFFLLAGALAPAFGQRAKISHSRSQYSAPKVRGQKAKIVCPVFVDSKYPYHGLGVKIGDPFALTYKYYPNKRMSIAVDVGKAASGLYNRYLVQRFDALAMRDTLSEATALVYLTHHVKADLVGEVKVLFHVGGAAVSEGLQGYAGIGWEWKSTHVRYDYQYFSGGDTSQTPFDSFEHRTVTMGPQLSAGIEYGYFRIPVSAFMEAEYFLDMQADPGRRFFQGGVGLRYIF